MQNIGNNDIEWLKEAIKKSDESVRLGGFPVGAVIVRDNKLVSCGLSNGKKLNDATQHAEIDAIRSTSKFLQTRDLKKATLYSSLEPCLMCFFASYWASIPRIVYACRKTRVSRQHYEGVHDLFDINSKCNRQIEVTHLKGLEAEALKIIENWENSFKR
jgi:tRNA(adenine34) deaminase